MFLIRFFKSIAFSVLSILISALYSFAIVPPQLDQKALSLKINLEEATNNWRKQVTSFDFADKHYSDNLIGKYIYYGIFNLGKNLDEKIIESGDNDLAKCEEGEGYFEGCYLKSFCSKVMHPVYKSPELQELAYKWLFPGFKQAISQMPDDRKMLISLIINHMIDYTENFDYQKELAFYNKYKAKYEYFFISESFDEGEGEDAVEIINPYRRAEAWVFRRVYQKQMTINQITGWLKRIKSDLALQEPFVDAEFNLRHGLEIGTDKNKELLEAIKNNDFARSSFFIKAGADVNNTDENGVNAMMWAAYSSDLKMVDLLYENGASCESKGVIYPDTLGSWYGSLLNIAVLRNNPDMLNYFIENCKLQVDQPEKRGDETGWTALQFASYHGNLQISKYLIEKKGASLNYQDQNASPLMLALRNKNSEMVKLLLSSGAEFDISDKNGDTPLHHIATSNDSLSYAIIADKISVDYINRKNNEGNTAVHLAVINWSDKILEALCKKGADLSIKNNNGFMPIDYALACHSYSKYLFLKNKKSTAIPYAISDRKLIRTVKKMKKLIQDKEFGISTTRKIYNRKFLFKVFGRWDNAPQIFKYIETNNDPEYEEYLYSEFTKIINDILEKKNIKMN